MNEARKLLALRRIYGAQRRDPQFAHLHTAPEGGANPFVPGAGDCYRPRLIFIGEAPGRTEAAQGVPFVGAAGRFLTRLLNSIGIARSDVWITNVLKWRPPGNREPWPSEELAALPYLRRECGLLIAGCPVEPLLVPLGAHATRTIVGRPAVQGELVELPTGRFVVPQYHPAAALYNPRLTEVLEAHFEVLRGLMDLSEARNGAARARTL